VMNDEVGAKIRARQWWRDSGGAKGKETVENKMQFFFFLDR
jgi:hypothetical protein